MRRAATPWDRFYRHHPAPWRGERPVADLLPLLGRGPVLELGCGNGKALRPLLRAGVDAVGLDVSLHALRRLGTGVLAHAAHLPFRDATFSAVLDLHCTGHLDAAGRTAAFAQAHRVLASGGLFVVERLARDDVRAAGGTQIPDDPATRRLADGRTTHFTDAAALHAELAAAGFTPGPVQEERRTPRWGAARVVRSHVRALARRR